MAGSIASILLAGVLREFSPVAGLLVQQGFEIRSCADGAKALELALAFHPPLVVVDTEIALLPAPKLAQILRTNPHTNQTSFFFVGKEGTDVEGFQRHRDRFIPRPFNVDQLLAEIHGFFNRNDPSESGEKEEKSVEGSLKQISLVDLLQVFGLNRKDGTLYLFRGQERGTLSLAGGRLVNAKLGRVAGEKAFFRLLQWEDGKFRFSPGRRVSEAKIVRPLDYLIMEGMRQNDEIDAHADRFPNPESILALKVSRDRLPQGLRPATQELLVLLETYSRVGDLLDHCPRPDLEILQMLRLLIEKGLLERRVGGGLLDRKETPLLLPEEIIAIKDVLGEGDILLQEASAKLILLTTSPGKIQGFLHVLQGIDEFEPQVEFPGQEGGQMLGDIGRLVVSDTFYLRLFSLPAAPEASPLWVPFARRLFGVVSLGAQGALKEAEDFFAHAVNVPHVAVCLDEPSEGMFPLRRGDRQDLRKLLAFFTARLSGRKPSEEDA